MFCPSCGAPCEEADRFCGACGVTLSSVGVPQVPKRKPALVAVWKIGAAAGLLVFAVLVWGLISVANRPRGSAPVAQANSQAGAVGPAAVPAHHAPQPPGGVATPAPQQGPSTGGSKRIDTPLQSPPAQISDLLRQSKYIYLGCTVDRETCEFLANALTTYLAPDHVEVEYGNVRYVEGIFTPPAVDGLFGVNQVNLELDQQQGLNGPQLGLDASSLSYEPSDSAPAGFSYGPATLPEWVQAENGGAVGPMEADKAEAAEELAKTFAAYWLGLAPPTRHP